jgi:CCR4-NOT transcriptional regulation complex NOT5 subunit
MKKEDIILFEKTRVQFEALYKELAPYALKKPNEAVNKFKIQIVNNYLIDINRVIGEEFIPISGFLTFDVDTLPSISDVSLVVDQYLKAMEMFRSCNIYYDKDDNCWFYQEDENDDDDYIFMRTTHPTGLRYNR